MYNKLSYGDVENNSINVVIEVPQGSSPVKYEIDKDTGIAFVDRFVGTPMFYPASYGFVPNTLAKDGDPVDVLVVSSLPLLTGCAIKVRLIGGLYMEDESGVDDKLLAVPVSKVTPYYDNVKDYKDLPKSYLDQIKFFFENYKALEPNKWVKVDSYYGIDRALEVLKESI